MDLASVHSLQRLEKVRKSGNGNRVLGETQPALLQRIVLFAPPGGELGYSWRSEQYCDNRLGGVNT